MAAALSSLVSSIKPAKFLVDSPVLANDYSSPPFVVVVNSIPLSTTRPQRRRRLVVTANCFSKNAGTSRDASTMRSSTKGTDVLTRLSPDEPRSGVFILVDALQREGVTDVFTNRNQRILLKALTATTLNTHVFLTDYCSELLAAMGYAMATGLPGVCTTSWTGLTFGFFHEMAYACEKNIPLVVMAVDGWEKEKEKEKGKDCGGLLDKLIKCRFRITSVGDIPKIVREALFVARSGRPGPVLIDHISYDSVYKLDTPVWDNQVELLRLPPRPLLPPISRAELEKVVGLLRESKRPLLYVGPGCFEWRKELTRFVEVTGIPVLKAAVVSDTPVYLTVGDSMFYSSRKPHDRFAVEHFDLLLALDIRSCKYDQILESRRGDSIVLRFDVCDEEENEGGGGGGETFLDVEVKPGCVSSVRCGGGGMKSVLERLNGLLEEGNVASDLDFSTWRTEMIRDECGWGGRMSELGFSDYVKSVVNEIANRDDTFIFPNDSGYRVRFWDWFARGPLVSFWYHCISMRDETHMCVTLPLVAGAAIGKGRRAGGDSDGEGDIAGVIHIWTSACFADEEIQELMVLKRENIPVKVVILNDVLQDNEMILETPDPLIAVRSLGIPCRRITEREEVRDAMRVMMETPGPYVLDIIEPYDPISIYDPVFHKEEDGPELYALCKEVRKWRGLGE